MKLRNKKTGEIREVKYWQNMLNEYGSLAELNEEWEDYEEPKEYWTIDWTCIGVTTYKYSGDDVDDFNKSIGNYFETKEEAEKVVEKLKAVKRLKDKGFHFLGWKFTPDMKHIQGNYVKIEAEIPQILINEKDIDLLFGGEE